MTPGAGAVSGRNAVEGSLGLLTAMGSRALSAAAPGCSPCPCPLPIPGILEEDAPCGLEVARASWRLWVARGS